MRQLKCTAHIDADAGAQHTPKPHDFRSKGGGDGEMPRFRAYVFAFITALILYSLLMLLHAVGYLSKAEDVGADLFMYLFNQSLVSKRSYYLYAFIDVDEATYSDWGEPLLIPRNKLLCLINFARASQAKLIFVDFDLSYLPQNAESAAAFARSLAHVSEGAPCSVPPGHNVAVGAASTVPIFLSRSISHYHVSPTSNIGRLRLSDSELEKAVPESDTLFWASTALQVDPDGVVRKWMLWNEVCRKADENESVEVIPSIALASQAILKGENPKQIVAALKNSCARRSCTDESRHKLCPKLDIGGRMIELSNKEARILYTIPWIPMQDKYMDDAHKRSFEDLRPPRVEHVGRKEPIVWPIRASEVTKLYCRKDSGQQTTKSCMSAPFEHQRSDQQASTHGGLEPPLLLRDRIVIIGGSYSAARDSYATPVREDMPGAVVLMNSIHTLIQHGVLHPPGWVAGFVLFVIQAAIVAAIYCFLRKQLFVAVAYVLLFCMTFFINGILLKSGVWIDANLATMGVFMYENTSKIAHSIMRFGKNVWNRVVSSQSIIACFLVAATVITLPEEGFAETETVGYVEFFNKPSTDYEIRQGSNRIQSVHHFAPVYAGDQIIVKSGDADAFIRLRLLDGQAKKIDRLLSPFDVPSPVHSSVVIDFLSRVGNTLTRYWDKEATVQDAVSRVQRARSNESGDLSVDIFDHPQSVVEGGRGFTLAWNGGIGPFNVELTRIGNLAPEFEHEELRERRLPPEHVTLTPGRYRIRVYDRGLPASVNREFEVVSHSELPPLPDDARMAKLPSEVRRTYYALWLAGKNDGKWALESYLQIDGIANTYELAGMLQGMLAQGNLPLPE